MNLQAPGGGASFARTARMQREIPTIRVSGHHGMQHEIWTIRVSGQYGIYYQLSYTHKMRSRTEHVWPEHVPRLKKEIAEYKKFKKLTTEVIDLSIELSKAKIALLRMLSDGG